MDDQIDPKFEEYTLSLDRARQLLSGVRCHVRDDGSWTWTRPEDEIPRGTNVSTPQDREAAAS